MLCVSCSCASLSNLITFVTFIIHGSLDYVGRIDCEETGRECFDDNSNIQECRQDLGDSRALPDANLLTHEILEFFSNNFGFTAQETVALMGVSYYTHVILIILHNIRCSIYIDVLTYHVRISTTSPIFLCHVLTGTLNWHRFPREFRIQWTSGVR